MHGVDLRIRVLGAVEARVGGELVAVPRAQTRLVLAILALRAGETLDIDELAELVWNGEPPLSARATLHTHVSRLRTALGQDALESQRPGYVLRAPADCVDALEFERQATAGRRALEGGDAERAIAVLTAALDLWQGRMLSEFLDVEFAMTKSYQFEERRLDAVEDRATARLERGDYATVVAELEPHVLEHPLRERAWGTLIVALHRAGRRAEAIQTYGVFRQRLHDELGIEPSSDLRALHDAMLQNPAELSWTHELPKPDLLDPVDPSAAARVVLLGRRLTVGRASGSDVQIEDLTVSRSHAVLERIASTWTVRDVGSANGTTVDGTPVGDGRALHDGALVRFGKTRFVFRSAAAQKSHNETLTP